MSKLVSCKACEKEVAKGVKKCPHCGKDQRNWFMRHKILSFIGAVVIIGAISAGGGSETASTTASTSQETKQEKQEKIFNINDVINTGKIEVKVTKVEEKAKVGNEFISKDASNGGTFVAIQNTFKNVSDKPVNPFSMPSIQLVDEKGTKYDADIDASSNYAVETGIDNSKFASDLNPDIEVTETKVFEISKEKYAQGQWFILVDGKEKVKIK
ncbi:DUF4352 domain-containing protein [Ectobacillus funiculus]|uniref:DUF4352 domain-containing protein n=1 Tax=Ectobacillus funiculus TaxID=137993 RepID=UPI00397E663B